MIQLRRGDSRTLVISNLVDGAGSATTFLAGDTAVFTIRRNEPGQRDRKVLAVSTSDGGIVLDLGLRTGSVSLPASIWAGVDMRDNSTWRCVCDLQLTRDVDVWTVNQQALEILADVSL